MSRSNGASGRKMPIERMEHPPPRGLPALSVIQSLEELTENEDLRNDNATGKTSDAEKVAIKRR
jgi:hypothetical protein